MPIDILVTTVGRPWTFGSLYWRFLDQMASVQTGTGRGDLRKNFLAVFCIDVQLKVFGASIYGLNDASITQCIATFVHIGKQVRVAGRHGVQFAAGDTESERAIMLRSEDNCDCPFCCLRVDELFLEPSVVFHPRKFLCYWPSSMWCNVYWGPLSYVTLVQCSAAVIRSNKLSHMSANYSEKFKKSIRCCSYSSSIAIFSCQSVLRSSSSVWWTVLCFFICWRRSGAGSE